MSKLEQLLKQEYRFEGPLIFYSTSMPPPAEPPGPPPSEPSMSFDNVLNYASYLSKEYGIPSPSIKPEAPSKPVTPENCIQETAKMWHQVSEDKLNQEESWVDNLKPWVKSMEQQIGMPSPAIKPVHVTSHLIDPKFNDLGQLAIAVHNITCPSNTFSPSPPVKIDSPIYDPPEFKIPECEVLKFDNHKISFTDYSKPEKKFYDIFKKSHLIRTEGLDDEKPVHALFKKNEFANVYNQVTKGLKLGKKAVQTIVFTNPLKNDDDFSPSFTHWNKELRFPAIKPKKVPFDLVEQKDYNKMLNNAFLPHELGHAKIEEKYSKQYPEIGSNELKGFNEHLANAFSFDSVKDTPQLFNTRTERIKFENEWVTPHNNTQSRAIENYDDFITSPEDVSFILGKQATINMLGESLLEQKYDLTLKNALELKYGRDPHKNDVYKNINKLSNLYQTEATKLVELSKKDTILSSFKAKRILSNVEKETFRFKEGLWE